MRVIYEGAIFEIMSDGGVARYFAEIVKRMPVDVQPVVAAPSGFQFPTFHPRLSVRNLNTQAPRKFLRGRWRKSQHGVIAEQMEGFAGDLTHWTYYTGLCRRPILRSRSANVITVFDFIHEAFPDQDPKGRHRQWQQQAIKAADHICCISQTTFDELCNRYPAAVERASVTLLGNTFTTVKPTAVPGQLGSRPFVLFVGRRDGYKNFQTLYKAWQNARQRTPDLALVLAGPPMKRRERRHLGMTHEIDGLFHLGYVSDSQLKGLYQRCQAFVFPSEMEGFGLPALEAMDSGAPVIASNCAALQEVAGSAGHYFDAMDVDQLTDLIVAVGTDSLAQRDEKVELGRARAKQFSWQRTTDQTVQAYSQVLEQQQKCLSLSPPAQANEMPPSIPLNHPVVHACRVCGAHAQSFAQAKILDKYEIEYQRCDDCHFIQTESPYWLDEAYQDAIISTDIGLVGRNQRFAKIASRILRHIHPNAQRSIDYGGGYGMFTRMMRDLGHPFEHYDPYCENLFARGFVAQDDGERYDLLTAFEVWEHMAEPHSDIKRMDALADHWLVSTMLVPDPPPKPGQWWYYALEGGQHVALWSQRSLEAIASQYGRHLVATNRGLHLLSKTPVNRLLATRILRGRGGAVLDRTRRRKSLLQADYQQELKAIERTRHQPEERRAS